MFVGFVACCAVLKVREELDPGSRDPVSQNPTARPRPQPLERAVVDGAPGPVDVSKAGLPRAERRASEDETTMRFWPVPPVDTGAP